ncbi:MAG: TonB-dependent receptor, partial [Saprospiraceae bacterium]|nr:TonB-dependent receptor [Saprospiraceae bacterium]
LDAGALTGSVGLVFNPNPHWQLSANFATGFRSPNVDDVGKVFDSEPGSVVVPNPDLRPEYAYNGEVGIARSFGGFLKLDLAAYYTLLDNALVRRNSTRNGLDRLLYDGELSQVQSIQNAAQATVR